MKAISVIALVGIFLIPAAAKPQVGEVIEQATIGAAGAVLCGFVAGEIAWIAAPEFPDEEDPYRVSLPWALGTGYGVGVPFGSALGVHLAGLVIGEESAFWPKWAGAQITTLAAGGVSYLILSNTEETLPSAIAYSFPIVAGIGGAFAGEAIGRRLGWAAAEPPPFRIGLEPQEGHLALSCAVLFRF
jgi:hypothetical protein